MNDKITLTKALNQLSKFILKIVIPGIGLKKRQEKALMMKYVDECSQYDIAKELGMTYESAGNFLCKARNDMLKILREEQDIVPDEVKKHLNIFNEMNDVK